MVLSTGYLGSIIQEHFHSAFKGIEICYVKETEPLGTGGAIKKALQSVKEMNVVIVNGDTLFDVDLDKLQKFHQENDAEISLALRPMSDAGRYGFVERSHYGRIKNFEEKKCEDCGNINGGIYVSRVSLFDGLGMKEKFSFEKDFLEKYVSERKIFGFVSNAYFLDIGIPNTYEKAQIEFVRLEY